jgi:predicted transcriptional regulator
MMEKKILENFIEQGLSQRGIANTLNLSQSSIKYWLKKYNLSTNNSIYNTKKIVENKKQCVVCNEYKCLNDFYKKSNNYHHSYCKKCSGVYYVDRLKDTKIKMIVYKGSQCVDCELHLDDTHPNVFDFHHLDPTTKDPNFKRIKFKSWDTISKELDQCVLLCSNCHRIRHS